MLKEIKLRNLLIFTSIIVIGILSIGINSVFAVSAPKLYAPEPDKELTGTPEEKVGVFWRWSRVEGVGCYRLEASGTAEGEPYQNNWTIPQADYPNLSTRVPAGEYNWKVGSCLAAACPGDCQAGEVAAWSETRRFTAVYLVEPTEFHLIYPQGDIYTNTPTFQYSDGPEVGCYEIKVYDENNNLIKKKRTPNTSFLIEGGILEFTHTYKWTGRACAEQCDQALNTCTDPIEPKWIFTVKPEVPGCPPCPAEFGEGKRLVPCGRSCYIYSEDPNKSESPAVCQPCQLCHFFVMLDGIIDFILFTLVPIIAVLMLVIGGVMYMAAHFGGAEMLPGGVRGGPAMLSQAKRLITSVVIGLVLIYGAWLIINTFLTIIGVAKWTGLEKWFEFPCP